MLKAGVCKTQQARLKPLKHAAAVEMAMAKKLKADLGFAGLITKTHSMITGRRSGQVLTFMTWII